MILALLGIRLKIVGMMASAPWSNLLPNTDDKCLKNNKKTDCNNERAKIQLGKAIIFTVYKHSMCVNKVFSVFFPIHDIMVSFHNESVWSRSL